MNPFTALKNLSSFHVTSLFFSLFLSTLHFTSLYVAIHIYNSLPFTSLVSAIQKLSCIPREYQKLLIAVLKYTNGHIAVFEECITSQAQMEEGVF